MSAVISLAIRFRHFGKVTTYDDREWISVDEESGCLALDGCDFVRKVFYIRNPTTGEEGGHLKATKTEASAKPLPMHPAEECSARVESR